MNIRGLLNKFTQLFTLISFDKVLLRKVSGRLGVMDVLYAWVMY